MGGECETLHLTGGGGDRAKYTAMKVPRQCKLVILVKIGLRGVNRFGM